MKLIFEFEDAIAGIICGLLLIGLSGIFFSFKLSNIIYTIAFLLLILFIVLDVIFELVNLASHSHRILTILSIIHNIIDFTISLAVISYFTGFNIPFVTSILAPYMQNNVIVFRTGLFLVSSNASWLLLYPFL